MNYTSYTRIPAEEASNYADQWSNGHITCKAPDHMAHGFICTRPNGHKGPHIAHTMADHAVAMWGDVDEDLELDRGL